MYTYSRCPEPGPLLGRDCNHFSFLPRGLAVLPSQRKKKLAHFGGALRG